MTRHTRVRQLHKFNKEKSNLVVNQPIKEAIDFYIGTEDIDPSFQWCSPWKTADEFGHFVIFDSREYGHFRVVDVK